jgi:polysaccharide export outer membrane protein
MTIPALKEMLKAQYAKWVVNPIVDVKVLNKEITVLGEVRDPQVIQVDKDRNSLLEMVTRSGGFDFYANLKYVKVLRQEGPNVRVANINLTKSGNYLKRNIQLYPGDIVIVPSKKNKEFDKRVSTIIPFTTTITAAAILLGAF